MRLLCGLILCCSAWGQLATIGVGLGGKAAGGGGTWSVIQHTFLDTCSGSTTTATCSATITSTGANHAIVLGFMINGNLASTITYTSASCGGSYTHDTNEDANLALTSSKNTVVVAYTLASSSGTTTCSMTLTQSLGAVWSGALHVWELAWSGSTMTYDIGFVVSDSTTCTSCSGTVLSPIGGTSDVIVQFANPENAITAITGGAGYTTYQDFSNYGSGAAGAINTTTGTGPTWTQSPTGKMLGCAIAIKGS